VVEEEVCLWIQQLEDQEDQEVAELHLMGWRTVTPASKSGSSRNQGQDQQVVVLRVVEVEQVQLDNGAGSTGPNNGGAGNGGGGKILLTQSLVQHGIYAGGGGAAGSKSCDRSSGGSGGGGAGSYNSGVSAVNSRNS
jgi:hypothetical protein